MNIGDAAIASGLTIKSVRYYANVKLIEPSRDVNGYRDFSAGDVHKLSFVNRARSLGFSVNDCRVMLSLYEDRNLSSAEIKRSASAHLKHIARKIGELEGMRATLRNLVERCQDDDRPDCPILDELSGTVTRVARKRSGLAQQRRCDKRRM